MEQSNPKLVSLYKTYLEVVNPLIIDFEVTKGEFPISILNEIKDFTCHVARHYNGMSDIDPDEEIEKAKGHIERTVLDCYKSLIILYDDICVKNFNKRTKYTDLSIVNNGKFIHQYNEYLVSTKEALKKAKKKDADVGKKKKH